MTSNPPLNRKTKALLVALVLGPSVLLMTLHAWSESKARASQREWLLRRSAR